MMLITKIRNLALVVATMGALLTPVLAIAPAGDVWAKKECGRGKQAVKTKFDFGCNGAHQNPIYDVAFAIIRFLSIGVGIVVVIAIVLAGIKYTTSEGNPEATRQAKQNIQNAILALFIYIFAFALINYLVPGGFLR